MIALEKLAKKIQEKLDALRSEFNFNIIADTGAYKPPKRKGNTVVEYINGVLTSNGSEITNLIAGKDKPLVYATQNCTLRVIMSLQKPENNEYILDDGSVYTGDIADLPEGASVVDIIQGWKPRLERLRTILDQVFQGVVVEPMTVEEVDENGKVHERSFSVTTVFAFSNSGIREQNQAVGDSYSFYINIYYSFIENGLNTRDLTFTLDGVQIPFQSVTVFRSPIMDGNVYSGTSNATAKNITSQSTFSVSFELPAFESDNTTNAIVSFLMDGEINVAHLLRFKHYGKTKEYLVTLGEVKQMGETIKNIGQSLSLVECPDDYDIISFPSNYKIYEVTAGNGVYTVEPKDGAQTFVFGGTGFITARTTINGALGDKIVSTEELTGSGIERVQ